MRTSSPRGLPMRCPVELRDEQVRAALLTRCRAERIEPPGPSRIERVLSAARSAFDRAFCARMVDRLPEDVADRLDRLVGDSAGEDEARGPLAELKADPGPASLETLLREVAKLEGEGERDDSSTNRAGGIAR